MLIYQYLIMCLQLFYPDDSSFSLQIPSPGIQTTFEDNVSVEEIDCSESRLLVTGRHGRQFRPTPVEEIDSSESRLLVTGRHGGQFRPTPVHSTYHIH